MTTTNLMHHGHVGHTHPKATVCVWTPKTTPFCATSGWNWPHSARPKRKIHHRPMRTEHDSSIKPLHVCAVELLLAKDGEMQSSTCWIEVQVHHYQKMGATND